MKKTVRADFRIVFLEDNQAFSQAVQMYFEEKNYDFIHFSAKSSLISYINRAPDKIHIYVIDRVVEDGQTEDIFAIISRLALSRFLVLTAYPSFESSIAALRSRAVEYLVKPVSLEDLERNIIALYDEIASHLPNQIHPDHEWDALVRTHLDRMEITLLATHRCIDLGITPSLSNIWTILGFSLSTVHRGVKDLVRAGWAECRTDPIDKRVKSYLLTEHGISKFDEIMVKLKTIRSRNR